MLQAQKRPGEAAAVLVRVMQLPDLAAGHRAGAASLLVQLLPQTGGRAIPAEVCRDLLTFEFITPPEAAACAWPWPAASVRRPGRRPPSSSTTNFWPTPRFRRSNASTCNWSGPTPAWKPATMPRHAPHLPPCWITPHCRPGTRPTPCSAWRMWPCTRATRQPPARPWRGWPKCRRAPHQVAEARQRLRELEHAAAGRANSPIAWNRLLARSGSSLLRGRRRR